ncbi:MAG: trimethylamine methyltransferase family protein [Candidatus Thorarchaeota archaeon]
MRLNKIEILSKDELEQIHAASLELLQTVGIKVDSEKARATLKENGAEVGENSLFVKFPESLITEKLRLVPNSFTLHGPDGDFKATVDVKHTEFATIGTPVKIYDPEHKKGVRKSLMTDTINQIRVVDSLDHVICSHIDVWPNDIKYTAIHVHCLYQWVKNTKKPYGLGCLGRLASQDMMNLTSMIVGGENELITHPRLVGFMNPTSPLHLPQLMTNGFEVFTKYKQPTIIAPEALAGTSSPVTLAGLLTQTNAEILGSAVLSQMYNPGAPIFYGTVSHITDMRTGNSAMGSVEMGLITAGIAQLARYYNIPSRGPGCGTDSKLLDMQNGYERFQTLMLAAQAGINYITCAGTYEATLVEALELLVIDDDLIGMVKRAIEGINVNEDTIGIDVIKKVATTDRKGMNFLAEKHTKNHMKNELYFPKLSDRSRRSTWYKKGAKDIIERAYEKVNEILESHQINILPKELDQKLLSYIEKVEARSFDEYKKAEDLMVDSITLPDGIEIKKKK